MTGGGSDLATCTGGFDVGSAFVASTGGFTTGSVLGASTGGFGGGSALVVCTGALAAGSGRGTGALFGAEVAGGGGTFTTGGAEKGTGTLFRSEVWLSPFWVGCRFALSRCKQSCYARHRLDSPQAHRAQ